MSPYSSQARGVRVHLPKRATAGGPAGATPDAEIVDLKPEASISALAPLGRVPPPAVEGRTAGANLIPASTRNGDPTPPSDSSDPQDGNTEIASDHHSAPPLATPSAAPASSSACAASAQGRGTLSIPSLVQLMYVIAREREDKRVVSPSSKGAVGTGTFERGSGAQPGPIEGQGGERGGAGVIIVPWILYPYHCHHE